MYNAEQRGLIVFKIDSYLRNDQNVLLFIVTHLYHINMSNV